MTKTTLAGRFLVMTMAGLLMASFAIAQNEDQPEVLMAAVHQRQLLEGADQVAAADTRLAVPAQLAGPSDGYTSIALVSVADGSLGILETLQATDYPQNVSRFAVREEMPKKWWCRLIFCKRGL